MNNAPFKVGDRVVALKTAINNHGKGVTKNILYTVKHIYQCKCGLWKVDVGVFSEIQYQTECWYCGGIINTKYVHINARIFALAEPRHEDAAIDEAIIEQARELIGVSETVAPVAEPVNN